VAPLLLLLALQDWDAGELEMDRWVSATPSCSRGPATCPIAGVKSPRLVEWSRRNVVVGKIAMAVLIVGMAAWLVLGL
jgi:hypothetical protein